jgi:uracil-DNA glycosylase
MPIRPRRSRRSGQELLGRNDLPEYATRATQPVFGEGPVGASLLFVGEQPGDEEDVQGRPFVGPPAASSTARWRRPACRGTRRT